MYYFLEFKTNSVDEKSKKNSATISNPFWVLFTRYHRIHSNYLSKLYEVRLQLDKIN